MTNDIQPKIMSGPRIYVASSWRNVVQPQMVRYLRDLGLEVYDFKQYESSFAWNEIDDNWRQWKADEFIRALKTDPAKNGFESDMKALEECDVCILLLPCGNSAHLEAGWAKAAGKKLIVYLDDNLTKGPELMYKMADAIVTKRGDLAKELMKLL